MASDDISELSSDDLTWLKQAEQHILKILQIEFGLVTLNHQITDLELAQNAIDAGLSGPKDLLELQCLGVILGNVFVAQTEMNWARVNNEYGDLIAIHAPRIGFTLYPFQMISKRVEDRREINIPRLYESFVNDLALRPAQLKQSYAFHSLLVPAFAYSSLYFHLLCSFTISIMPFPIEMKFVERAEGKLNKKLPLDYIVKMCRDNGGTIGKGDECWFLYPIFDDSDKKRLKRTCNDIVYETTRMIRDWSNFPSEAIVIGDNGCGDKLILLPKEGQQRYDETLYWWDHETGEVFVVHETFKTQ